MSGVFIVAELSANHGHKLENALAAVRAAREAGADAIKLQTYTADTLTINCDNEFFQIKNGTIWDGRTLYQLYSEAYTPWEWHIDIKREAEKVGLLFFSTPFDKSAVDFLVEIGIPMLKIASFEIIDIPLIEYIASKKQPVLISTGIATIGEIKDAVDACRRNGCEDLTLLQCTSAYPADPANANLLTMKNMMKTFNVKVGISDHTQGSAVAVAAVAMGATVIEKHFILDRKIGGPDAAFSMEPHEFRKMVDDIRVVEKAIGNIHYHVKEEIQEQRVFARSLFVVKDCKRGEVISDENVRSIRPGYGLEPKHFPKCIGRKFRVDVLRGTPLSWELID